MFVASFVVLFLQLAELALGASTGFLSPSEQRLVTSFLAFKESHLAVQAEDDALLPTSAAKLEDTSVETQLPALAAKVEQPRAAKVEHFHSVDAALPTPTPKLQQHQSLDELSPMPAAGLEHDSVDHDVATQRADYTETGQSERERQLLTDMGRLEDQLESYKRVGPTLHRQMEKQASSLRALETKAMRIEDMAATLWWDSKMLMCVIIILGFGLCIYVAVLHRRLISATSPASQGARKAEPATALKESDPGCEYYSLLEDTGDGLTPEERWWNQPCSGPR